MSEFRATMSGAASVHPELVEGWYAKPSLAQFKGTTLMDDGMV